MANKPKRSTKSVIKKITKAVAKSRNKSKRSSLQVTGVGHAAPRAFGSNRSRRGVFDATLPAHLPLPIATGPYTVIRVTQLISSANSVMAFGTFRTSDEYLTTPAITPQVTQTREGWGPYCAVGGSTTAPGTQSRFFRMRGLENLGQQAQVCPSAYTVQIMNPNALNTTNGILYIGRMKTQLRGEDATETWNDLANEFVAYQAPRLCSAGKLALRGVKLDACPFNLKELQDFDVVMDPIPQATPPADSILSPWSSTSAAAGGTAENARFQMKGFAPIMVYNPNAVTLQYLVTMELRCRFDMGHPASSTHEHHVPATQQEWAHHVKSMLETGHGCMDIVESVAQAGELATRFAPLLGVAAV